jgi:Family of unknown function (DUF6519)
MHGDFTRDTFDPAKNYSRVLMQQGRVTLDADWNEQTSILLRYLRLLTRDIFGPYAGPWPDAGFEIIANLPEPQLETRLQALRLDDARHKFVKDKILAGDALIAPGRYYVDGLLVENHRPILYSEQPGAPFGDHDLGADDFKKSNKLLLYLDVWERDVTYLEDDHIREVALGGPDTCGRAQVFWQVRLLRAPDNNKSFDCNAVDGLRRQQPGTLRARTDPGAASTELCVIAPDSRYRGAENQLYRVEVHRSASDKDGPTFVWSRDNGSVVFPIRTLNGNVARLANLGRDRRSTLNSGDWVEIVDEQIGAQQLPGVLAQVEKPPDRDNLEVTLAPPPKYDQTNKWRPMLRRWDHRGDPAKAGAVALTAERWIDLEDGVQVWFSKGGDYRAGDYWLIPARTATGDVEWPYEPGSETLPKEKRIRAALPPRGVQHHYAPLLLSLPADGAPRKNEDCRWRIERLPLKADLAQAGWRALVFGSANT